MVKKSLKTYEAYRHSEIFNRDNVIMTVRASSVESARTYFKEKLKKLYGDERSFFIREKRSLVKNVQ